MKKLMCFFSCLLILVLSMPVLAEVVEVGGVVYDAATGEVLPGANIFVKGTMIGAASNLEGKFSFTYETDNDFDIVVGYMGYESQEMAVALGDDVSDLKIDLQEDVFRGEAVVVTGIASKTSKDVAQVAVSRVPAAQLTVTNSYSDVSQMITGKVPGVSIQSSSGNVGGGMRFNVRSGGGLNGDEQPVIYVDGVRIDNQDLELMDLGGQGISTTADINPEEIENIEFLKGPAAAASYGTDGSNGVVLITTKRGQQVPGKPKGISIDYKMVTGLNRPSYEYGDDDPYLTVKDINEAFIDGPLQQNSLSIYGGSGLMKYYLGIDRRKENGIMAGNTLDRNAYRANLDIFPNEKVMVNISTSYTRSLNQRPQNDNNIFGTMGMVFLSTTPYFWHSKEAIDAIENKVWTSRFIGSVQAQYIPMKNLQLRASVGMDESHNRNEELFPADQFYLLYEAGQKSIYFRNNRQFTYNFNGEYTYNLMDDLKVRSVAGLQIFDRKLNTFWITKQKFATELVTNIDAAANLTGHSEHFRNVRTAGIFTEHSFSYKDQYFLTGMIRKDYSSVIGVEAPSILYPGFSGAIRLDKFGFLPKSVNLMKLRAAYGETGQLPSYLDGIPLFWTGETGGAGLGAVLDAIGNAEIEPERIKEIEVGIETELFNKYAIELTYYKQMAENSIIDFDNAPSTGKTASSVPFNIGSVEGQGFESLIQARPIQTRNVQLDVSLVNNYQTNEVTDLGGAQPLFANDINVIKEGLAKHTFYHYKVTGAEYDGDGFYVGPALEDERSDLGNPVPSYTGSFALNLRLFKNLSVNVLANWALDYYMYNYTELFCAYFDFNHQRYRELSVLLQTGEAQAGYFPEIELDPLTPNTPEYMAAAEEMALIDWQAKSNYVEKADYFKLQEVSVSYSFKDLIPKIYGTKLVQDLTLGVSGINLLTITEYGGADPEVNETGSRSRTRGSDFLTIMHPRVLTAWLRLSL